MEIRKIVIAGATALLCAATFAQAPPASPKPGPEVKKLSAFVGKWTEEGDLKASPMGPAGKMAGTDNCEWTAGGFAVMCHESQKIPGMFNSTGTSLIAYDANAKQYTYAEADSTGMSAISKGTVDGDTWTWTSEGMMNGQNYHQRFTMKFTSKDEFDFKFEIGTDANSMSEVMNGKEKRMTAAAKPATK